MEVDYAPTEEELKARQEERTTPPGDFVFAEPAVVEQPIPPVVSWIAMGFVAFAVIGLVIWAGLRLTKGASNSNYAQSLDREVNYQAPDPNQPFGSTAPAGLSQGSFASLPGRVANAAPVATPFPPADPSLVNGPFIGQDARQAAKDSLRPIHDLLTLMRQYDTKGLWNPEGALATAQTPDSANPSVVTSPGGTAPVLLPGQNPMVVNSGNAGTRGATFQSNPQQSIPLGSNGSVNTGNALASNVISIEHIHLRTDSLGTQTDLTLTPELYADPLRPDVKAISQEIHAYLKDADLAANADSGTHSRLRSQASLRLAAAQKIYDHMDGVIDGTADVNRPPFQY